MKMTTYLVILALGTLLATLAHAETPGPNWPPQQQQPQQYYPPPAGGQFAPPPPLQQDPCCCARPACAGQASDANVCSVIPLDHHWVKVVSIVYGDLSGPIPSHLVQSRINHYSRLVDRRTGRRVCEVFQNSIN